MTTVHGIEGDWQDRYYHVDQILDKPGPRTDPSFLAGDEVRIPIQFQHLAWNLTGPGV
jgi:hypothetical protein